MFGTKQDRTLNVHFKNVELVNERTYFSIWNIFFIERTSTQTPIIFKLQPVLLHDYKMSYKSV